MRLMRQCPLLIIAVLSVIVGGPHLVYAQGARLTFLLGQQVEVRGAMQRAWQSAKFNQTVVQGDTIRTGQESRVEITFADGSIVRVSERSRMVIKELTGSGQAQRRGIKVMLGKVWANAAKLLSAQSTLKVESPTTVAAIRGTIYRMNVEEQATTEVRVYDGEVAVSPAAPEAVTPSPSAPVSPPSREFQGPREVRGPREVSMSEWLEIVRAMQRIVVAPDGTRQVSTFSATEDAAEDWVQWNQTRDQTLKR